MVEKRHYVRMDTVFPVELAIYKATGERTSERLLQAFTRDVSEGGMCLELKSFGDETEKLLSIPAAQIHLTINPPFSKDPIEAFSEIIWIKKEDTILPVRYLIGVAYTDIRLKDQQRIIGYAKKLAWLPRIALAAATAMLIVIFILFVQSQALIRENKKLVKALVQSASAKSEIATSLNRLEAKKSSLESDLKKAQKHIETLEESVAAAESSNEEEKAAFEKERQKILDEKRRIQEALVHVEANAEKLQFSYETLEGLEKSNVTAVLQQMSSWIESHQNLKTGLVASFEGDATLEDWAFTYDQSLACQTFLIFGDEKRARAILDFYETKAERGEEVYFNVYDASDGRAIERQVLSGPNLWIGLAALQFEHQVRDGKYLPMAKRIGDWIIKTQDTEGGIKGGPAVTWYSTEHNLDSYAFLNLLYQVTHEEKYKAAASKSLSWIKKYAYSLKERRMNRGKGDATIATDTFSWAVAAVGPAQLKVLDFDAEEIMRFAEDHCSVTVSYKQPGGKASEVKGFDFAKSDNVGRGGVLSTEWTAQVIVTYRILSSYFAQNGNPEKEALYREKAKTYLTELQKMIITSPSRTGQGRGCLPYASKDNVETGHGWRTPKGARTGSVAGTAYGIFAWMGYNPFSFERY